LESTQAGRQMVGEDPVAGTDLPSGKVSKPITMRGQEASAKRGKPTNELPEAVRILIEARTGDAVYVVGPDYTIVPWDEQMESLTGALSEEAVGKPCYGAVMGGAGASHRLLDRSF
jgi:PAS domain-containing protein